MPSSTPSPKLNIAVIGLGRLGREHARHLETRTPRANLVAVFDVAAEAVQWAKANLSPNVVLYDSYQALLAHDSLDAVVISTNTASHAEIAIAAIKAGKHCLLEKPISTVEAEADEVVAAAEANPACKVSIAFSRRFDASYKEAKARLAEIGDVYLVKSATLDHYIPDGPFDFMQYAPTSGGIFIDCGIHDIDLARFFLGIASGSPGPIPKVKKVYASGTNVIFHELAAMGDCDNAYATVDYDDGKAMVFHLSRTNLHGHDVKTELFGTKGSFAIGHSPRRSLIESSTKDGIRYDTNNDFWERFSNAFVTEVNDFVAAVLDDTELPTTVYDGLESARIAEGLKMSFQSGQVVFFKDGRPVPPSA